MASAGGILWAPFKKNTGAIYAGWSRMEVLDELHGRNSFYAACRRKGVPAHEGYRGAGGSIQANRGAHKSIESLGVQLARRRNPSGASEAEGARAGEGGEDDLIVTSVNKLPDLGGWSALCTDHQRRHARKRRWAQKRRSCGPADIWAKPLVSGSDTSWLCAD
ncbi:hypothetical protein B0H11DRAFT_2211975 [Mycena galericulata]|nr:hypothetical protein B0H11DRAFT_2211975 [Mycena galericulata]